MDHRVLIVLLWTSGFSPGLQTEEHDAFKVIDDIRLVGGSSRCSGELQGKIQGVWRGVEHYDWNPKSADRVCRLLDCGSVVRTSSTTRPSSPTLMTTTKASPSGGFSRPLSGHRTPMKKRSLDPTILKITCSDSVRLVNGKSLCSGRLEVKSNQSNQSWSSVCEDDFDLQDAEVVCRELGCGAPSVLQGALYGDVEAPVWTKEFQCGGNESALLDCDSSAFSRNTCSAVGLTCSELLIVRLVGGSSRCAGELEMKQQGEWRPVDDRMSGWNLKTADEICRKLDCGSAVSTGGRESDRYKRIWWIRSTCLQSKSAVRECILTNSDTSSSNLEINCSESVRLVNGKSLCSGRLEVKSNQSSQSWSSVCEDDFDLQDAEVVCRELGCRAPSVLQGALYGDVEAPVWTKEFQCGGHESALLDCDSSDSDRNTCSPGKAAGLTCSEPDDVRLVGGASRCVGRLEMKHKGEWRPVADDFFKWDLMSAAVVCKQLDCGSVLSTGRRNDSDQRHAWRISSSCRQSESSIRECVSIWPGPSSKSLEVTCSDSVRLVNGKSLCSGRLEVTSNQSNQSWSSVCEDDFDLQDAEVVCRELGCGAPSVLQGALYGDVEAPVWTKEFQCGGHESALLDCDSSDSDRNTCSPGKAVGLTCSEPDDIRLLGGSSRCDAKIRDISSWKSVWWIQPSCVESHLMLRECLELPSDKGSSFSLEVICSDILAQPNISFATFIDGVSEANQQGIQVLMGSSFTISCSILPQYPGGSFQLILTTSATSQNHTLPAVNHSAHFLFSAAEPAQRGEYRCVYHLYVFSYNFSSESQPLHLTVSASVTDLIIRLVVLLVLMVLMVGSNAAVYCYCKAPRGQKPRREDNMELDHLGGAGDLLGEEAGAQGTE
ncbi:scavenger receptor cysteine-rich type 1 protein M130-like isoform X2 [Sebastes fasciatus]|uniref:scavenger receptor cysteine-rich type 1 protein M130-like isoform X2 n=1 Tax=Sebastes fasciatus TaxID=394691 RepID=UPI003D9E4F0F